MNPERIGCGDIDPKERDPWDEIETTSANDVECRRDVPGEVKVRSLRPGFDDLDRVAS